MSETAKLEQIELIGFRPDKELGTVFVDRMNTLDVTSSELARTAVKLGLAAACRHIAREKTKQAKAVLNRLSPKGQRRPFNRPLTSYSNNALTVRLTKAKLFPSRKRMGS